MATVKVYDQNKQESGEITLASDVFEIEVRPEILNLVARAQMAAKRAGTHMAKTRALVSGGGVKPWKQKGTGRARAGLRQSPVWRGGGVAMGPKPRDYGVKVNRKVAQLAFRHALSEQIRSDKVLVVESFDVADGRTRLMAGLLKQLGAEGRTLIVTGTAAPDVERAARNLPKVVVVTADNLDVYSLVAPRRIVVARDAWDKLVARMGTTEEQA